MKLNLSKYGTGRGKKEEENNHIIYLYTNRNSYLILFITTITHKENTLKHDSMTDLTTKQQILTTHRVRWPPYFDTFVPDTGIFKRAKNCVQHMPLLG